MANLPSTLHFRIPFYFKHHRNRSIPPTVPTTKIQSPGSVHSPTLTRTLIALRNTNSVKVPNTCLVSNAFERGPEYSYGDRCEKFHVLKRCVEFIRGGFPGGIWWRLADSEREIGGSSIAAEPMSVFTALNQMWALINDEKGVLYTSFGALIIAALSEISMPGIITDSVFSAFNGETLMFYRKSRLLVLLCLTSGICSGLRSGCFAMANMILSCRLSA